MPTPRTVLIDRPHASTHWVGDGFPVRNLFGPGELAERLVRIAEADFDRAALIRLVDPGSREVGMPGVDLVGEDATVGWQSASHRDGRIAAESADFDHGPGAGRGERDLQEGRLLGGDVDFRQAGREGRDAQIPEQSVLGDGAVADEVEQRVVDGCARLGHAPHVALSM